MRRMGEGLGWFCLGMLLDGSFGLVRDVCSSVSVSKDVKVTFKQRTTLYRLQPPATAEHF